MGLFATTSSLQTKMVGTVFDTATTNLASACIYDAESEIKKQLSKRYDFAASPFLTTTTIPPIVTYMTETLALGYMYENMARGSKEGHQRADRYIKRVMDNLTSLQDGDVQLMDSSGSLITEITGDWIVRGTNSSYSPTFNEDDPTSWAVDQDKLDDIADERD